MELVDREFKWFLSYFHVLVIFFSIGSQIVMVSNSFLNIPLFYTFPSVPRKQILIELKQAGEYLKQAGEP